MTKDMYIARRGRDARPARPLMGLLAAVVTAAMLAALGLPGMASAAGGGPIVTTGGAKDVAYASATLAGVVNPRGSATSYYFQYGPTRAYGAQTAIASAGAGTANVKVALGVTGLQPLTIYHYRLVAVNEHGTTVGADEKFQTTKVPLSLAILVSPNPVLYGGPITVQGTLSGTDNANRQVVLQASSFPFTAGYVDVGNVELTNAQGGFSFTYASLTLGSSFRVVTTTNPPIVSAVVGESVAPIIVSHVARTSRRGFARFYGAVTPAMNGLQVAIMKIVHGHSVLVGGTVLRHADATSSKFSRIVRVGHGIYRVLIKPTSGGLVRAYGQSLLIG